MRRIDLIAAAALLIIGNTAFAQAATAAKPNFSGKWTILPDSAATAQMQGMPRGNADYGGLGEEATIVQDDKTVTITRNSQMVPKSVFALDGSDTRTSIDIGNGNMADLTLRAHWDGAKLATGTWAAVQGQTFEIDFTMWLDDKGNLVTEHTIPPLGNGMGGGTFTTKYKKGS